MDFDSRQCRSCIVRVIVREKHALYRSESGRKYGETKALVREKRNHIKKKTSQKIYIQSTQLFE